TGGGITVGYPQGGHFALSVIRESGPVGNGRGWRGFIQRTDDDNDHVAHPFPDVQTGAGAPAGNPPPASRFETKSPKVGRLSRGVRRMGTREELLHLAYMKLVDAVELLQRLGEDLMADEAEAVAAKVGRAALAVAKPRRRRHRSKIHATVF